MDNLSVPSSSRFSSRDVLMKSGHVSSFLLAEIDHSRPSSPVHPPSSVATSSSDSLLYVMSGVRLPLEVMKRILDELGKRGRRKFRMANKAMESLVGASFLPTPVSGETVTKLVEGGSKFVGEVEELIVPLDFGRDFVNKLSGVRKMHFSESNLHCFNRLHRDDFPHLRKVTFQGSTGLKMDLENVPKFVEDIVFWSGSGDDYAIHKKLLEDTIKHVERLRSLEVWSGRQYPDLSCHSLLRLRLMGGVMASSISHALHQIINLCPQLEELVICCKALAAFNAPDHFDRASVLSFAHPVLKKLRILHSFTKPISLAMPCLQRLTLDAPQHHFVSLSKSPALLKLSITASPLVASNLFLRPPPSLTTCVLSLISGHSSHISKNHILDSPTINRPPSVPSLSSTSSSLSDQEDPEMLQTLASPRQSDRVSLTSSRSHVRSASIAVPTPTSRRTLKSSFDDSSIPSPGKSNFADSIATSPTTTEYVSSINSSVFSPPNDANVLGTSPSSRRKILTPNSNRHSSGRPNDICISIASKTLKKCDIRIATMEDSFPRVRDFKLDAQNLEHLIFQIHPNAVAPLNIHIDTPSIKRSSTCLHPNLLPELFPSFEKYSKLEKLFVTLQDEDVAAIAPLMQPYLNWDLGTLNALGLSNMSILTGLTVTSSHLHSLVLENVHALPFHLLENLDQYLPSLFHLEIKAPELDDGTEDDFGSEHNFGSASTSRKTSSSEIDQDNPFFMQKEYRDLCPKQRIKIRSSSLRSLLYSPELPYHPIFDLPQLRDLLYIQQEAPTALNLKEMLKSMPKLEQAYIGVVSIDRCHIVHLTLKKLKLVFGFAQHSWSIKAPLLEKAKFIRILNNRTPLDISLTNLSTPSLKYFILHGIVIDEDSHNKIPDSAFIRMSHGVPY